MRYLHGSARHFRRRVATLSAGALAAGALSLAAAGPAAADIDHSHDPIGSVSSVTATTGGLLFKGWAADPDALSSNATLVPIVDGYGTGTTAVTSVPNSTVQTKYGTGPTPGFAVTIPVDTTGSHTVCLAVRNVGAGYHVALKCVVTPLGTTLTTAQRAAHNPAGKLTGFTVGSTSMHVTGYATDPDWRTRRLVVVLYVNGVSTSTVMTTTYVGTRPAGVGQLSAFDITVPVTPGAHLGCIWVVNVGIGYGNTFLGCRSGDTRGPAGTTALTTVPALNTNVVAEAKRHLGQPYVWGAAGPTSFDCSGLVKYTYGKYGYVTPRVSEDQFLKARLIPASRALPGDLVFYHDTVGDVYHVGIYVSPGKTIAAIDESQGVAYQTIWDPSSATYGSFTHS